MGTWYVPVRVGTWKGGDMVCPCKGGDMEGWGHGMAL